MKILFLISQLPYPPDTGAKTRTLNLIKKSSLRHKIDLVAFGDEKKDAAKVKALEKFCKKIHIVSRRNVSQGLGVLLNFFSGLPYNVEKYYSRQISRLIDKLMRRNRFDLLHCDSLQVSRNVLSIQGIPKVLTEHNVESQIIKRYAENERNLLKKAVIYYQWKKLLRYELSACKEFNSCIAVSDKDRQFLSNGGGIRNISVVPNGVDTEYFKSPGHQVTKSQEKENSIVFTGSMDWLPNSDAVEYFCKEILALIWEESPDVRFYVVGKNPSSAIQNLAEKDKRIVVTAGVEDVRPYIAKSRIAVVPLRIGGGTRLKILEAMAMGKPVVSTTIGAEGLEVEPDKNIVLADEPQAFAERVGELLKDSALREKIGNAGRLLVEEKYDWRNIAEKLNKVWEEAINYE